MKGERISALCDIISTKFKSEAAFARFLGWTRQKLNLITNGKREPTVAEINDIALGLGITATQVYVIFLSSKSPNGQLAED